MKRGSEILLRNAWMTGWVIITRDSLSLNPSRAPKQRLKSFIFDVRSLRPNGERRGGNFVAQTRVVTFVSAALPEFSYFGGSMDYNQLHRDHYSSNYMHATRDFNLNQLKVMTCCDQSRLECRRWQAERKNTKTKNWPETFVCKKLSLIVWYFWNLLII